ncbi:hypothetical protein [Bacillus phage vB_BanS-Thrax4]|nr:hypothetical protein [Bacillus phage vB_BanS-Thrax4]
MFKYKLIGLTGVWTGCILASSVGLNSILFALKWGTTTLPSSIAMTVLPLILGSVITYTVLKLKE